MGIGRPQGLPTTSFGARTLRKRFIEVQNDYKEAMRKKIERGLVELQTISVNG